MEKNVQKSPIMGIFMQEIDCEHQKSLKTHPRLVLKLHHALSTKMKHGGASSTHQDEASSTLHLPRTVHRPWTLHQSDSWGNYYKNLRLFRDHKLKEYKNMI
jgi:hypothetical protein